MGCINMFNCRNSYMYSFCYTSNDFRIRLFTGIFFGLFSLPFIYELLLGGKLRVYVLDQHLYWGKGKNIAKVDLKKVKSIEITLHKSSTSSGKSNFSLCDTVNSLIKQDIQISKSLIH